MTFLQRQKYRDKTKQKNNRLVAISVKREELTTKEHGNEKVLYLDHGSSYMTIYLPKFLKLYNL